MVRITRNILIFGRRTSFRLEPVFWDALGICARQSGVPLDDLLSKVVRDHRGTATMASAIRVFAINYFHDLAERGPRHGTA